MEIDKQKIEMMINQMQSELGIKFKDIFASYHFQSKDFKYQGFGNIVCKFPLENFEGNMGSFIEGLQKTISMALYQINKIDFEVKILFWRT